MAEIVEAGKVHPKVMNPKLLTFLAWIFYLAFRRTLDDVWLFCLIYCAIMALCALFYRQENKTSQPQTKLK